MRVSVLNTTIPKVQGAYEAGPTGFGLARELPGTGVGCVVAAPGRSRAPSSESRQDQSFAAANDD